MAGHGPAPKPVEQRRDRHPKLRGEWVDLPATNRARPPKPSAGWSSRTVSAWNAWWRDPASLQWTPADRDAVWALAELLDAGLARNAAEIRLRSDGLGLTQKGKRDLRWRVAESDGGGGAPVEKPKASAARRSRLKVV